ncbi:hypothetical protein AXX16_1716 [Serratia rubidaea]|nr:hypothetical protein AXX16_1716 [Serratia rubidaea]
MGMISKRLTELLLKKSLKIVHIHITYSKASDGRFISMN